MHRLSLLQRLLIVEGVVFLVLFSGAMLFARWFADGLRDRIEDQRLASAEAFAAEVNQELTGGRRALEVAAGQRNVIDLIARESPLFTRGVLVTDRSMRVVDSDTRGAALRGVDLGGYLAAASRGKQGSLAWAFRPWEAVPGETEGALTLGLMKPGRDAPVLALAVPVGGGGYVIGLIDTADSILGDIMGRAQGMDATGQVHLIDERGVIVASTSPARVLADDPAAEAYVRTLEGGVPAGLRELPGGQLAAPAAGDGGYLMGLVRLHAFPWIFALGGSSEETFGPIRQLWTAVYGMAAVLGTFAVVVTVAGTARLVRPVLGLRDAAHRVADGDLETPMPGWVGGVGGEIGQLAESIETMRRALRVREAELDRRVEERTRELEQRTHELSASAAIARAVGSTLDLSAMLEVVAAEIESQLAVEGVVISVDGGPARAAIRCASPGVPNAPGDGPAAPCRECVTRVQTVAAASRPGHSPDARFAPPCLGGREASVSLMEIRSGERAVGMLCIMLAEDQAPRLDSAAMRLLVSELGIGIENATLYADLHVRKEQREALLAKVLSAQEEERRRLARELHDETGQALTGLMLGLDGIARGRPERWELMLGQVGGLRAVCEEALENLRLMILALRPAVLDDMGLVPAISRYAERVVGSAGIEVSVQSNLGDERLHPNIEVAAFRIVQESLNNVVRHSGAACVRIRIRRDSGVLRIDVGDDGKGFTPREPGRGLNGVGIEGMIERAELLGGELTIDSAPGGGTTVRLEVNDERGLEHDGTGQPGAGPAGRRPRGRESRAAPHP